MGNEKFSKGSYAEIHSVVEEDKRLLYNILFAEKAVIHMAFSDQFINKNLEKVTL